ncbi:MAG: hypothetical protein K8R74_05470, partial [Bacteroidales bacterium]|nr:hypothetical protein [Bacteroidales bacterium]
MSSNLSMSNGYDSLLLPLITKIDKHKQQGNYKEAFVLNKKLMYLKDSITELSRAKMLIEMQESFKLESKLKQLDLLNAQNKANEEELRVKQQQQLAFIGTAVLLLIISVGLRHRIITIRKTRDLIQLKNDILQQERIKATNSEKFKNQFLANVSHEIRTPMNAIMGITNILIKNKHLKEQEKFLEAMHLSSKNLLILINDILDLSKLEAGKVEIEKSSFKISEIIKNIETQLREKAETKGIEFKVVIDPDVPEILLGDPHMLHSILLPILSNGITFTDKGIVSIDCNVEGNTENNYIISFIMKDTGIGIIKEKLDQILNTFVKVHEKDAVNYAGSGLELAIIKQMIELQGGSIQLESEPGKGTTFYIEIPYTSGAEMTITDSTEKPVSFTSPPDLSILLVEDNEFNVMVATEEINSAFKHVLLDVAENGKM